MIENIIFLILAVIISISSFVAGFIMALKFADKVFHYYKKENSIKNETFPFLKGLDTIQGEDEKKRVAQNQKEGWESKVKSLASQHL